MSLAEMSNKKFETEKERDVHIISENTILPNACNAESNMLGKFCDPTIMNEKKQLRIPRKPFYKEGMTVEAYKENEGKSFIAWRKSMAEFEEAHLHLSMTLFEKSLSIWRQLWIVLAKSDVICQIVDARNPEFFMCPDLAEYVKEIDSKKKYLLLVNKSDFLNDKQREYWSAKFIKESYEFIFFSAISSINTAEEALPRKDLSPFAIYSRTELLRKLRAFTGISTDKIVNIGMIGYPNVGKSSVINAIIGTKKVAVAEMPGKTKHMQTVLIDEKTYLLDCPGLVFPSITNSYAEMVCNGVVAIDRLKEFISPINLVLQRIPKEVFEAVFKIKLPDKYNASVFLQILAKERGYVLTNSVADQSKTAKLVLKNYCNGVLLYCHEVQHMCDQIDLVKECQFTESPMVVREAMEKHLDNEYFEGEESKMVSSTDNRMKPSKWQKRQMKYAERRGEDADEMEFPYKKITAKTKNSNEVFKNKPGHQGVINSIDSY